MTENHSFGCYDDQMAMGLQDLSKAKVYQKPEEMNEEELFCKLFPEYAVNGKPLSPYFDLFESGYEQSEKRIAELEKENEALKGQMSLHEGLLWNDLHKLEKENAELRNNGFTVSAMTEQQLKVALEKGEQLKKEQQKKFIVKILTISNFI